ncbi:2-phosphosulfolactate phosphatase [Petroclostridium sp. X23]|uniref:2-phosphosulfolactate phosphatase n=1 Tax=Petroclostridium sp. X23 TaxID=3045146 RepID=UPI0024AD7ADA|nr:2-phosphosulfolactate phosphatase [Petroclostridium sp. X23]WHH57060.1 2-phosphosulfolactate phosphatase [Petroclostridium sp. X23]
MRIDVIATAGEVQDSLVQGRLTIVIDVLRATSTIVTALLNGCKGVAPVYDIEKAWEKANQLGTELCLMGGERNAVMIEGFQHGNSPLEYTRERVDNKYVILTTTNGTKAIHHSKEASHIVAASFLNGQAVAEYAHKKYFGDVAVVCAGTEGKFSLDDFLCAGKLIHTLINNSVDVTLNDLGIAAENLYKNNRGNLHDVLKKSFHYARLYSLGFQKDVEYCMQEDICSIVPVYTDELIVVNNE